MIKEGVPEDKLVKLTFHKSIEKTGIKDFKWMKKKEFRYKGEMYDIVRKEIRNDSITYTCIHDVKESKLFANLDKHIEKFLEKNPAKKKDFILIKESLNKFYFINIEENSSVFFKEEKYSKLSPGILEGENFIHLPPPKV